MPTFVLQGTDDAPHSRIDYHRELNQEQLDVVLHGDGPCLVLAGAGSGKTRTVTYRVAYLLEHGVEPSSILLVTFTNKAAREMTERVAHLLGHDSTGVWSGTFHSIANRLLRMNAERLGYTSGFSILDQEDARNLIKSIIKERAIDASERFPSPAVVQDVLSYSTNVMTPIAETLQVKHQGFERFAGELQEIARLYAERKRAANAMDFDDLLVNWLKLVCDDAVGPALAAKFRYVLVDEYQDTNALQARIVQGMAAANGNLLVVGDDAQSIYAFRGADVKNILRFPDMWPNTRIFKLVTNYRSTPQILDVANDSLAHNTEQFEKDLVGVKTSGAKPLVAPTASAAQEAQYIAEQILALRKEGMALSDVAVLFRSSAHSQTLEFELAKRDIPYEYRGGMRFFGRAHIKDALAYVRVAHNVKDEAAWLRVLTMQQGIGATTASTVARRACQYPDARAVVSADFRSALGARAKTGWDACSQVLGHVLDQPSPSRMLRALLQSVYRDYLEREYPDWRDRMEDLEQLVIFAEGYTNVDAFLSDIALYDDVLAGGDAASAGSAERMVLSTIHQAKGLEWDTVFIMHLSDHAFPNQRAMEEERGIEEERRLFYVATTRARNRLFLTFPLTMGYDTLVLNRMSMFLEELSPRLIERMEVREARRSIPPRPLRSGWSEESGEPFFDEEVIDVDENGNWRSSGGPRGGSKPGTTMWKKK